jgi:hypothetical protein
VRVAVAGAPARGHGAAFAHGTHQALKCRACHTTAVSLDPAADVLACSACHADHHAAGRACASCHTESGAPAVIAAHAPPASAHRACAACHQTAIVAGLVPDRPLCLTCHAAQRDHYAGRDCTPCHGPASPADWRAALQDSVR